MGCSGSTVGSVVGSAVGLADCSIGGCSTGGSEGGLAADSADCFAASLDFCSGWAVWALIGVSTGAATVG